MKLVVNYSMLGARPTGLGVYANNCRGILDLFECSVISSEISYNADRHIASPASITIGAGKWASLRRPMWARTKHFGDDELVYSPTHHGFSNVSNQIITIHDLISLRFPRQHYPQYLYFKYGMPRLLKRCKAVFVVSEATREDVINYYGFPREKIYVVPNAVDRSKFSVGCVNVEQPYLLMVGARYTHKNVDELLRMSFLWKDRYRLVITSCGGGYKESLINQVAQLNLDDKVEFLDYVDQDKLLNLYQRCSALVYPSKWEGFGIPPLEVLACGRPVIASDIPAHREVLKESGLFVSLGGTDSWRKAFNDVESADVIRGKITLAQERLNFYTKENAVSTLKESLLSVAPNLKLKGGVA